MSKENNVMDFTKDLADAIREKSGGDELINPQDFADRIRALPVRGEVDHEWHIYFDDTKPASLYGGDWEELAQGTFIMSAGSGSTAGQTGGSNTVSLKAENNAPHSHEIYCEYGVKLPQGNLETSSTDTNMWMQLAGENSGSRIVKPRIILNSGSGTPFSIVPTNISAHIWKRVS